ncbi:MAG: SUMF1/EgtB/PvdO family nonheme iron enzyme [Anaerolineales bacterium]|nr:SUMF1/EgtB/PvdO family nonheme iron enzyme [Anaerolineales bacterium]MCB8979819.1 SUMF1/EgtB/PvdO family nonheme iron enzyme [Ardenticatenaceae bacterium]
MTYDKRQLNEFIIKHFNDEELRILCAVEFPDVYDDFVDGWGKKRKVMELIGWCERNAQEERLLTVLQRERPRPFRTVFGRTTVQAETVTVSVGERNPRQIFISHAHQDAVLAQRLATDLSANGWQTWIAPDSIQPGEQWVDAINRGLDESGVFLVLLTPEAVSSKWVKRETNIAVSMEHEGEVAFYPLDVKPCRTPALWRGYQFVSFKNEYQTDVSRLLKLLAGEKIALLPASPKIENKPAPGKAEKPKPAPAKIEIQPGEKPHILIPNPPDIRVHRITGKEMIRIPAGDFLYGKNKRKRHLPEFWIAKMPVTNAEYARFVTDMGIVPPNHWEGTQTPPQKIADHPVVNVSWHDAQAYAKWANCQLPTEGEWEKSARGIDGRQYPWGNDWQGQHCNTYEAGIGTTSPVGQFSPQGDSPYGCVDMSGNVWEWVATMGDLRGGAFVSSYWDCSVADRYDDLVPSDRYDVIGFRVAEHRSIFGS